MCRALVRDAVAGPIGDRLVQQVHLTEGRRECRFRGGKILGNAGGREPQHPSGGGAGTSSWSPAFRA